MIDFSTLQGLTIPEGVVTEIKDENGVVLWSAVVSIPAVLEVAKVTSNTYVSEVDYTNEEFILLDIYPKSGGTVYVTYEGLTKTITDTSGAAEPNAQQVFFGTFGGVSDEVSTPTSGTLTIEGDYRAFAGGSYKAGSKGIDVPFTMFKNVVDWGSIAYFPTYTLGIGKITTENEVAELILPSHVKIIKSSAFCACLLATKVELPDRLESIGAYAFKDVPIESLEIPSKVEYIGYGAFGKAPSLPYSDSHTLKNVKILATVPPEVEEGGSAELNMSAYNIFGEVTDETLVLEQIVVPKGCGDAYKTATGWSLYADYIVEES